MQVLSPWHYKQSHGNIIISIIKQQRFKHWAAKMVEPVNHMFLMVLLVTSVSLTPNPSLYLSISGYAETWRNMPNFLNFHQKLQKSQACDWSTAPPFPNNTSSGHSLGSCSALGKEKSRGEESSKNKKRGPTLYLQLVQMEILKSISAPWTDPKKAPKADTQGEACMLSP